LGDAFMDLFKQPESSGDGEEDLEDQEN